MRLFLRFGLVILALTELVIGGWQQLFPESFYRDFPTVQLTPPYSEHFVRDVGGGTLALAVILAAAAYVLERRLVVIALVAYLVWAVPHLVFHLGHAPGASPSDVAFLSISLGASVGLPVLLLAAMPRAPRETAPAE